MSQTPICDSGEHLEYVIYKGRGCIARCYRTHPKRKTQRCSKEQYYVERAAAAIRRKSYPNPYPPPVVRARKMPTCPPGKHLFWVMQGRRCIPRCLVNGPRPETRRCNAPPNYHLVPLSMDTDTTT